MEAKTKHLFLAFFIVFLLMCLTLIQINRFMKVLATCDDDFAVIDKCGCVPCSWKSAEEYNGKDSCDYLNLNNYTNTILCYLDGCFTFFNK